jgi:hypothetical protein
MTRRSKSRKARTAGQRKWSAKVTRTSDAIDVSRGMFADDDPGAIARALKRSAERSTRRNASPFRSALSFLTFYIKRAGKNLSARRRAKLERAKEELRELCRK